jgi:hypothetical protein
MSSFAQVVIGHVVVVAAIGGYALSIIRRARRHAATVRREDLPWT